MRFDVITLFPELFAPFLTPGITRRAYASGQVDVHLWNPRDHAEHRGALPRELVLPPGAGRVLILRTDYGPAGDGAWDWPLVGNLRIE